MSGVEFKVVEFKVKLILTSITQKNKRTVDKDFNFKDMLKKFQP